MQFNKIIPELSVTDLKESLKFYQTVGFKIEYERVENKFVFLSLGEIQFMIQEISLDKDTEVLIENDYTNKLIVRDKKVAIVESDCPGMDCVHSGWISGKGRSLVCLPNRVEIRIEGDVDSEVDFIVR